MNGIPQILKRYENFQCERLQGTARLIVKRHICVHEPDDETKTHETGIEVGECANKFDCGLFVGNPNGAYHAVESPITGCCAFVKVERTGDL